jgi:hypothetical protein
MAAPGVELRAQIDAETVKALLYMHGGASIALLAFLPSVFEKPVLQPLSTAVLWALFVYQVGLVCTVIHNRLRRKCSLEYEAAGYKPKPCDRTWLKWLSASDGPCVCCWNILVLWLSIGLFVAASLMIVMSGLSVASRL